MKNRVWVGLAAARDPLILVQNRPKQTVSEASRVSIIE